MRTIYKYGTHYDDFWQELKPKVQAKICYVLDILSMFDSVPSKYMKHVRDGIYELRVEYESNIYRVFFIFDEGNIVILFNGFTKKTQKTPPSEIEKALRIKKEYLRDKAAGTLELEDA